MLNFPFHPSFQNKNIKVYYYIYIMKLFGSNLPEKDLRASYTLCIVKSETKLLKMAHLRASLESKLKSVKSSNKIKPIRKIVQKFSCRPTIEN